MPSVSAGRRPGIRKNGPATRKLVTQNPLDEPKDQVAAALSSAGVPFIPEQEIRTALLIEEQRQASEDEIEAGLRFQF